MNNDYLEYVPRKSDPLHGIVHRMAYRHFRAPLPPERSLTDSYIKLSRILEGEVGMYLNLGIEPGMSHSYLNGGCRISLLAQVRE